MRLVIKGGLAYILFLCFIESRPVDDAQFFLCCVLLMKLSCRVLFLFIITCTPVKGGIMG